MRDSRTQPTPNSPRHRRPRALPVLTLFLVAVAGAARADKALDILRMSIKAESNVALAARVEICVYAKGRVVAKHVQRLLRMPGNRKRTEVLAPPDLAQALIVSDGRTEWEYHPKRNTVRQRPLPPPQALIKQKLNALDLVSKTLHAAYLGVDTVAGRKCHVIAVRPPDGRVVRKKIWVDTLKHVELKWARFDRSGALATTWTMTSVDFHPQPSPGAFTFQPPPGAVIRKLAMEARMPLEAAQKRIGFAAVLPGYLPPGFVFQRDYVAVADFAGCKALWLQFLDGVDTFSIFEAKQVKLPHQGTRRAVFWESRGLSFLLVGRLPPNEVEKIKHSTLR